MAPSGKRGGGSGKIIALVAGALTLVLAIVGVVVWQVAGGGDDPDPDPVATGPQDSTPGVLDVAWTAPYGQGAEEVDRFRTAGGWITDTAVVRLRGNGAVAYALGDGKQVWTAALPAGTKACSSSPSAEGGVVAVAYGAADKCDQVGLLNLADGKLSAGISLDSGSSVGLLSAPGVILAPGVALVSSPRAVTAINLADGKIKWTASAAKYCYFGESIASDGDVVVASADCLKHETVLGLGVADGAKRFEQKQPDGLRVHGIVSAKPAVLVSAEKIGADRELSVLDGQGAIVRKIPTKFDAVRLNVLSMGGMATGANRYPIVVRDNVLFATNDSFSLNATEKDQVIAVDLTTGQRKWGSSANAGRAQLIRVDDKGALVLETYHRGARLAVVDLATGATKAVASGDFEPFQLPTTGLTLERGGTVAMLPYSKLSAGPIQDPEAVTVLR